MRRHFFIVTLMILLSVFSASAQTAPVSGNEDLTIPEGDITSLQYQALQGSGSAALRLSLFYLFVKYDNVKGMYWTTISAEDGDPKGMYSLGVYLIQQNSDHASALRARFWLERAKAAGNPLASEVLHEMDKQGR